MLLTLDIGHEPSCPDFALDAAFGPVTSAMWFTHVTCELVW